MMTEGNGNGGVQLRSGRHPHEVFLLAVCVLISISALATGARPQSVEETFPFWIGVTWYAGLIIGSSVALYGIRMKNITGLLLERAALRELIVLSGLYVATAIFTAPKVWYSGLGVAVIIGFTAANVVRARQITLDLRRAPRAVKAQLIIEKMNGNGNDKDKGKGS